MIKWIKSLIEIYKNRSKAQQVKIDDLWRDLISLQTRCRNLQNRIRTDEEDHQEEITKLKDNYEKQLHAIHLDNAQLRNNNQMLIKEKAELVKGFEDQIEFLAKSLESNKENI